MIMTAEDGQQVGITWQGANVSRALHSISKVAGPEDGPGQHDILFNNKMGVVVPAGIVNAVVAALQKRGKKPLMTYKRKGGLYTTKVRMRSSPGFTRRGA